MPTLGLVVGALQKFESFLIWKFHLFPKCIATGKDFLSYSQVKSLDVMYYNYTFSLYYMQDKNSSQDGNSPTVVG